MNFSRIQDLARVELRLTTIKIRVRSHCNIHGWSRWKGEEEEGGGGIPGFPYESILIGIVIGLMMLWKLQRR